MSLVLVDLSCPKRWLQPIIRGSAERLRFGIMRSRYTAFTKGKVDYFKHTCRNSVKVILLSV